MLETSEIEERLAGHTELCTLRYETIGKRLDKIEKGMSGAIKGVYSAAGLLMIQLFTTVFFLLGT